MPSRLLRRLAPVAAAAAVVVPSTLTATAAHAAVYTKTHCVGSSGQYCYVSYGKVTHVDDGDTIDVDVNGDGTSTPIRVRFLGLNAMELHHYSTNPSKWTGECWGVNAAKRVYAVFHAHPAVKLMVSNPNSMAGSSGRYYRAVFYKGSDGHWHDLAADELSRGLGLFDTSGTTYAFNARWDLISQKAQVARVGMWSGANHCGTSPSPSAQLQVKVNWDADSSDTASGEWADIRNLGASDVTIGGWWFRDSFFRGYKARGYVFPSGTVVPAGGSIRLHAGSGTNDASNLYWGLSGPPWENTGAPKNQGDGGYLFDPKGNMRFWMSYPCLTACPTMPRLTAQVHPTTPEYVDITNNDTSTVALWDYMLYQNPDFYHFHKSDVLQPGQTVRLYMSTNGPKGSADYVLDWGLPVNQLPDGGDDVRIVDYRGDSASYNCAAWGNGRC